MRTELIRPVGGQTRPVQYRVIKNSEVIKVNGVITDEAVGVANVDAVTEAILGYVTNVVTKDKISLDSPSADVGALGGTYVASSKQYTAASDNQTVDGVLVEYIPIYEGDQLIMTLDADKGTTTGSNVAGYNIAVLTSDHSLLDESTAAVATTDTQFRIVDPLLDGNVREVVVICTLRQY